MHCCTLCFVSGSPLCAQQVGQQHKLGHVGVRAPYTRSCADIAQLLLELQPGHMPSTPSAAAACWLCCLPWRGVPHLPALGGLAHDVLHAGGTQHQLPAQHVKPKTPAATTAAAAFSQHDKSSVASLQRGSRAACFSSTQNYSQALLLTAACVPAGKFSTCCCRTKAAAWRQYTAASRLCVRQPLLHSLPLAMVHLTCQTVLTEGMP
jgi:hypothetical protein